MSANLRELEIRKYQADKKAKGEFVVPLGAAFLGCSNCRMSENEQRSSGTPILYCAVCPVTWRCTRSLGKEPPKGTNAGQTLREKEGLLHSNAW
jgi:hypothetical protein